MAGTIIVDFRVGKFEIHCPAHTAGVAKGLPSHCWLPSKMAWSAPLCRLNVDYIESVMVPAGHTITPAARSAIDDFRRSMARLSVKRPFPPGYKFKTEPMPHQESGLDFSYGQLVSAYFADMGCGKTKLAIDKTSAQFVAGVVDAVVVVVPASIRLNWVQELDTHCPIENSPFVVESGKEKQFRDWASQGRVFPWLVVGVESLQGGQAAKLVQNFTDTHPKFAVIIDESSRIKNHKALRSKACVEIGKKAVSKIIMTGTPLSQGPEDLYMQFEFLDPDIIGLPDFYSFRQRYCVLGGFKNKKIIGYKNMEELTASVNPYVFQVRKKDVLKDIPPKVYQRRVLSMAPDQLKMYRQIVKDEKYEHEGKEQTVSGSLEKMLRLQEVVGGFFSYRVPNPNYDESPKSKPFNILKDRLTGNNPKITELLHIVEESGLAQVIVWCVYKEEIRMVCEALRQRYGDDQVVEIHGDIDQKQRHEDLYGKFQTGRARFLVGNPASGAMGLNMTAAELVVYYSNSFKFEDREQSEDRAHRKGQTKQVTYVDLVMEKSVDLVVAKALARKMDVSEFVRQSLGVEELFQPEAGQ